MNKKIKKYTKQNGGITIFISIILLFILALLGTLIESARVASADLRVAQTAQLSLNSVFSEYVKEVFKDYGILLLWEDENEIVSELNGYLQKNINYKNDFIQKHNDLLGIKIKKLKVSDIDYITNSNGEHMANQIYNFMKYKVVGDAVNILLDKCNSLLQGEKITEFFDKISNCTEKFKQVEESVSYIKKAVDKVKEITILPMEYLDKLKEKLNMINEIDAAANIKIEQGVYSTDELKQDMIQKDKLFEEFKSIYVNHDSNWNQLMDNLEKINNKSNLYFQAVTESEKLINTLKKDLEEKQNSIDNEIYELMETEIQEIDNQIANQNIDAYGVRKNFEISEKIYQKMESAAEEIKNISSDMEGILYNNLMLSQLDSNRDYIKSFLSELEMAESYCQEIDLSSLNIFYDVKEVKESDNDIIGYIEKLMNGGWLSIVTDEISEKEVAESIIHELPSKKAESKNIWNHLSITEQAVRKALMGQYILDYFTCYTDKKEIAKENKTLDYEIEYILGRYDNDRDNLKYVLNKIIAIREGFNLIYLFKNTRCREEAYLLAVSLVGFTGMPIVIRLTQVLVMGAWAYAESLVDMRDLLNGYNVKIIKSEGDWNLSLTGISKVTDKESNKKSYNGLSYKEYLRFLLFTENAGKQTYGIMDMIQLNIQNRYNDNFSICQCILGISVKIECQVERLFTSLGFIKNLISNNTNGFVIHFKASYYY